MNHRASTSERAPYRIRDNGHTRTRGRNVLLAPVVITILLIAALGSLSRAQDDDLPTSCKDADALRAAAKHYKQTSDPITWDVDVLNRARLEYHDCMKTSTSLENTSYAYEMMLRVIGDYVSIDQARMDYAALTGGSHSLATFKDNRNDALYRLEGMKTELNRTADIDISDDRRQSLNDLYEWVKGMHSTLFAETIGSLRHLSLAEEQRAKSPPKRVTATPVVRTNSIPATIRDRPCDSDASIDKKVEPDFPAEAREQGVTGTATVKVGLSSSGEVTDVVLYKSSGNAALDNETIRAARASTYLPALKDCRPIESTYLLVCDFQTQ